MSTGTIVLLVILAVLAAALVALYFYGKKLQKKQEEQNAAVEASKQPVTMLIIDKKRLPIKQAGLPDAVYESTPRYLRRSRLPIVKGAHGQVLKAEPKKKGWLGRTMDKIREKGGAAPVKRK